MKTNIFALKNVSNVSRNDTNTHSASFSNLTQTKFITSSDILPSITVFANVSLGNELHVGL